MARKDKKGDNLMFSIEHAVRAAYRKISKDGAKEEAKEEIKGKAKGASNSSTIDSSAQSSDIVTTEIEDMERLHIRVIENTIDILYRPNHDYLEFVSNDEKGKERVKELASMSREEFAQYLKEKRVIGRTRTKIAEMKKSDLEKWWNSAWSSVTKELFEEIGIENPVEEVIWS